MPNIQSFKDGINLPKLASPPSSPKEGDIYNDAVLGLQTYQFGRWTSLTGAQLSPIITEWVNFPSNAAGVLITATGSSPSYGSFVLNKAIYRRVGDSIEIDWSYNQNGTTGGAGSGTYLFNLPAGFSIDLTKHPVGSVVGNWYYDDGGYRGAGDAIVYSATQLYFTALATNNANGTNAGIWGDTFAAFSTGLGLIAVRATVSVDGWIATGGNSNGIAVFASSPVSTSSSGYTNTSFVTVDNSPAFTFTPTISGTYEVYADVPLFANTANAIGTCRIFNTSGGATLLWESQGVSYNSVGTIVDTASCRSFYNLTAGVTYVFDIQIENNPASGAGTISVNAVCATFRIFGKLVAANSSPITLTVAMKATIPSGTVNVGADAAIKYNSVVYDTHNAYSTGTGFFTAPIDGVYIISVASAVTSGGGTLYVAVNGVNVGYLVAQTAVSTTFGASAQVMVNVGDTIAIYTDTASTMSSFSPPVCVFSISKAP